MVLVGLSLRLEQWKANSSSGRDHLSLLVNKTFLTAHGLAAAAVGLLTASTMLLAMEVLTRLALTFMQEFKVLAGKNIKMSY